jgi:nitrogen fixation NifU-like protein
MPHLDDLYREVVLDHYRHPRGRKKLDHPSVNVEGFNPTCGDQVHVALALEGDHIREAEVQCQGCSISVASGSMMAELLVGKTQEEVNRLAEAFKATMHGREPQAGLDLGDLEALEGVRQFPVRIKCALLAWTTMQEALEAFAKSGKAGEDAGAGEAPGSERSGKEQ